MYLSDSIYRTRDKEPYTIGEHVSSGCIRMANEDVIDLYNRAHVGTKVIVLPMSQRRASATAVAEPAAAAQTRGPFTYGAIY